MHIGPWQYLASVSLVGNVDYSLYTSRFHTEICRVGVQAGSEVAKEGQEFPELLPLARSHGHLPCPTL